MISAIKPASKESYDRNWKLEKDEENLFVENLDNASRSRRRRRRLEDQEPERQSVAANTNFFENPSFNIITGKTNYTLLSLASKLRD